MEKVQDVFQAQIYGTQAYREMHNERPPFPTVIDIEPTNACNLDCLFCARQIMTRPLKVLPLEWYRRVAEEASEYLPLVSLRFSGWGEPTLHPDIVEMIGYARGKGVLTHLTTNAVSLDEELTRALLAADLNKIKFSLQGLDAAEYARMRRGRLDSVVGGDYEVVVDHINKFIAVRNELKVPCHIQVSVSMLAHEQEDIAAQQAFYDSWYPKVDSIWGLGKIGVYGGQPLLTSFQRVKGLGRVASEDIAEGRPMRQDDINKGKICAELYSKISVGADGALKACCDDVDNKLIIGWLPDQTIKEVWDSEALRNLREALEIGDPANIPPFCLDCDNYF